MGKTKAETISVRLPTQIYNDLVKLRNDNNLSTVGSALQYWINQQQNEKIEVELSAIRNNQEMFAETLIKVEKKLVVLGVGLETVFGAKGKFVKKQFEAINKLTFAELKEEAGKK